MGDSIGTIYVDISARMKGLEDALNSFQAQLLKAKQNTQSWGDQFAQVGKTLAIAGGAITAALTAIVLKTVEVEHEFAHMSEKSGISVKDLSDLSLSAQKGGMSIEQMTFGLKFLATQMLATAGATDKQKTVLGALGIAATDSNGKLRPFADILPEIADKFKGMEDGAVKVKLAVALFGRAGMEMIPVLNQGAQGFAENAAKAKLYGTELNDKTVKAAAAFKDAQIDLAAATAGLGRTIGEALMPAVKTFIEGATNAIVKIREWAAAHPALTQAISSLGLGLGAALSIVGSMLLVIPKLVSSFGLLAKALGETAAGLGLYLAALTVVVTASVYAYQKITELTNAKNQETEADYNASVANDALGKKLRAVADAAGITRAEFVKLTEKYDGNNATLAMAIKRGEEGTAMQKALSEEGKKHAAILATQTAAVGKLDPALQALIDSLDKSAKGTKALKDDSAALTTQLAKMGEAITNEVNPAFSSLEKTMLDLAHKIPAEYKNVADDVNSDLDKIVTHNKDVDKKLESDNKTTTNVFAQAWANMITSIAQGWSEAFVKMFGLTNALIGTSTKFIQAYFDKAKSDLQKDYDANMSVYDGISNKINDTYSKASDAVSAYYNDLNDQADQQLKDSEKTMRREYEDRRDNIMATVPAGAARDAMLKQLDRDYEDSVDNLEKQHAEDDKKRKADELAAQIALDDKKKAEEQALADKKKAIQNKYQADLAKIQADEDKSRDEHAQTELDRQNSLWTKVKTIFGNATEGMLTAWVTQLVTPLLTSIVSKIIPGVSDIGTAAGTMGTTVGNAFKGIGDAISGVVGGIMDAIKLIGETVVDIIAYAITTLATAIATAITTLAAAAPALLELGLVAAAIYTAFKLGSTLVSAIGNILGAGGGGNKDLTDWYKVIFDNFMAKYGDMIALLHQNIDATVNILPKIDNLAGCINSMKDTLGTRVDVMKDAIAPKIDTWGERVVGKIGEVVTAIKGSKSYLTGGYVPENGLAFLHRGEVVINPSYAPSSATMASLGAANMLPATIGSGASTSAGSAGAGASGGATTINLSIYAQTLDDSTIRQASEKIYRAIEYEKIRRGKRA
jgi:hypothetical protein